MGCAVWGNWMRWVAAVAFALMMGGGVTAQPVRSPAYLAAEQSFNQRPEFQRLNIQLYLTAAGFWSAVPNVTFGNRLYQAISQFQSANGLAPTGELDDVQMGRLSAAAAPMLGLWEFRRVTHPSKPRSIWVPFGLDLIAGTDKWGPIWEDTRKRLKIDFSVMKNTNLADFFSVLVTNASNNNGRVHYKVIKPDFFAISSSSASGVDMYVRFHRDGSDLIGFFLAWKNSEANLHMERVATLMSGSLWSAMSGAPFPDLPARRTFETSSTSPPPSPAPTPPPVPTPRKASSGTGFFVTAEGHILTNAHVVDECAAIEITTDKQATRSARLVARDKANDLALLKVDVQGAKAATMKAPVRLGDPIAAFGFPLSDILSSSGNFTLGNVTALSGIRDDSRFLQVSAPVQPGNSGGPLLDHSGNVVGIVTSKLNALKSMASNNGDIPQNVNFAIRTSVASNFLDSNRIETQPASTAAPMQPADLADKARQISVFIKCN